MKAAKAVGMTTEELECLMGTFDKSIDEFHQEMMGLPYEAETDKTERMVMCDNRPCHDPGYPRSGNHQRGRSRWQQDNLPMSERTNEPPRLPLTRVSEDCLATRICNDANRIVPESPVE
jgi:hypothetical protein